MKVIEKILLFLKKCTDDAVGAYAAFAAFFVIVSFFPFVMLLLTLLQFLPFSATDVSGYFSILFPASVMETLNPIIDEIYSAGTVLISATAVAAIWSASKGVYALVCGLNSVYDVKETRNVIMVRAMSVFYTIVFLLLMVLCIGILIFGGRLYDLLEGYAPWLANVAEVRYVVGLILFVLFFLLIFCTLPNRKGKISSELPGAIIAALGWVGFSMIYSYYIDHFSAFPVIYGSIAAVVFMMLWLYFCFYITLLAAEINSMRAKAKSPYDMWAVK